MEYRFAGVVRISGGPSYEQAEGANRSGATVIRTLSTSSQSHSNSTARAGAAGIRLSSSRVSTSHWTASRPTAGPAAADNDAMQASASFDDIVAGYPSKPNIIDRINDWNIDVTESESPPGAELDSASNHSPHLGLSAANEAWEGISSDATDVSLSRICGLSVSQSSLRIETESQAQGYVRPTAETATDSSSQQQQESSEMLPDFMYGAQHAPRAGGHEFSGVAVPLYDTGLHVNLASAAEARAGYFPAALAGALSPDASARYPSHQNPFIRAALNQPQTSVPFSTPVQTAYAPQPPRQQQMSAAASRMSSGSNASARSGKTAFQQAQEAGFMTPMTAWGAPFDWGAWNNAQGAQALEWRMRVAEFQRGGGGRGN